MGYSYDQYLADITNYYESTFCYGEPKVIAVTKEYEFTNDDGTVETSDDYTYSCEECECKDCDHWHKFHKCEPSLITYRDNEEIKYKYDCTECKRKDCEYWKDYNE